MEVRTKPNVLTKHLDGISSELDNLQGGKVDLQSIEVHFQWVKITRSQECINRSESTNDSFQSIILKSADKNIKNGHTIDKKLNMLKQPTFICFRYHSVIWPRVCHGSS